MTMEDHARALTIAGSDSGGGAGLEADLKTFTVFKVYGMAVVTSVTAQNTKEVTGIQNISPEMVGEQIDAVVDDIGVDYAKTGMLSNSGIIDVVAEKIRGYDMDVVIDPVMVTKQGDSLMEEEAEQTMKDRLIPLAEVVTPNIREAEMITGKKIGSQEEAQKAASDMYEMGAENVVIKGLRSEGKVVDILYDGSSYTTLEGKPLKGGKHGSGCTFSSAITANLAKGKSVSRSIEASKEFINEAIEHSFDLGEGEHPVNQFVLKK